MVGIPELKTLKYVAKRVLKKELIKKIKSIKDKEEQVRLFEYSIKSALELKYAELKEKIQDESLEKDNKFTLITEVALLGSRIKYFTASFHKEDFIKVKDLFEKIEWEIKR